jgi:hypothetical protein
MLDLKPSATLEAGTLFVRTDEERSVAPQQIHDANTSATAQFFAPGLTEHEEGLINSYWSLIKEVDFPHIFAASTRPAPWVQELYDVGTGRITDDHVSRMFDALEDAIYSDIDGLDVTLALIDVRRLASDFIVGIPRALFPIRDHLFNWQAFVLKGWSELSRRHGSDVQELLQGLL